MRGWLKKLGTTELGTTLCKRAKIQKKTQNITPLAHKNNYVVLVGFFLYFFLYNGLKFKKGIIIKAVKWAGIGASRAG